MGPPKTGTSAVQHVLAHHDNSAVIYPKVGLWRDGSHHNLVFNFFRNYARAQVVREDAEELFARIAVETRRSQLPVVISSEVLYGAEYDAGAFIRALLAHLGDGFEVEVLFVVRDHLERAGSVYNQFVRSSHTQEQRKPDAFLVEVARTLCYAPVLRRYLQGEYRITPLHYAPDRDFVARFMNHIGCPLERGSKPSRLNISLSTKALVATLAANRAKLKPRTRVGIVRALRQMQGQSAPPRFIFGQEAVRATEPEFCLDREFLREKFGFDLAAPDLTDKDGGLWISAGEFGDVAEMISGLGPQGAAICEYLREFIRPSPEDARTL